MMKGQKGITLVALIITIIVMLILVGVSISVALNGGLFDNARDGARKTKQAQVAEAAALAKAEVLSAYYNAPEATPYEFPDGTGFAVIVNKYLDGITVSATDTTPASGVYTITTNDVEYIVDADKNIEEKAPVVDLSTEFAHAASRKAGV